MLDDDLAPRSCATMDVDPPTRGHTTRHYAQERKAVDAPDVLDYAPYAGTRTPLVIDNGSSSLRAGWATQSSPYLERDSVTAKYRERKANKPIVLVGQDVHSDATAKANLRVPFENDVLCNQEAMVRPSSSPPFPRLELLCAGEHARLRLPPPRARRVDYCASHRYDRNPLRPAILPRQ
jgi:hypothetical protein